MKKKSFYQTLPMLIWIFSLMFLYIVTDADIISRYLLIISPFFILIGLKLIENLKLTPKYIIIAVFLISAFYSQFIFYKLVKTKHPMILQKGLMNVLFQLHIGLNRILIQMLKY